MRKRLVFFLVFILLALGSVAFYNTFGRQPASSVQFYTGAGLGNRVQEIASAYNNSDIIVVSKKDHLLYYCRKGLIVRGDRWGGFVYDFPVPVSLGANNRWTPEGKFTIYTKNPNSRYTLFLGFKGLYGIHGAETRLASKLNMMEAFYPDYQFVTKKDQTLGCVAVENRVIRYLYAQVDVNTPVLIMP